MIGGVILSERKTRMCILQNDREGERTERMRHVLTYALCIRRSHQGLRHLLMALRLFFSLCNPLSGPLKFRSITAIQCYSTLDATICLLKTFHHSHPRHTLAPPSPSGPCLRAPLSASSQVPPQYVVYIFCRGPPHTLSYAYTTGQCLPSGQVPSIVMSDILKSREA